MNERVHKVDFFVKEVRDCVKKHYTVYKCGGARISLDGDLSQIG